MFHSCLQRYTRTTAEEKSVYVLDAHPAVHRIDLDGTLLASFGRKGQGPGELTRPVAIHIEVEILMVRTPLR